MPYASSSTSLQIARESVRGTAADGTFTSIPVQSPTVDAMVKFQDDDAFRGSPVLVFDEVALTWHTEVSFKGYVYPDTFPLLLIAALGPDVVTGDAAPYLHTIGLENNAATGSQPTSVTIQFTDGANQFQVAGAQLADLEITGGADKATEWTAKFIGNPWTVVTGKDFSFSTESLVPGWSVTTNINSSNLTYVSSFTLKIDRKTESIFTQGQQGPFANFAGPCDVSGTLDALVDSASDPFSIGDTAWALYREPLPLVITLTSTADEQTGDVFDYLAFQMSVVQFMNVKRKVDKIYTDLSVDFKAEGNATDAVDAGYANIQPSASNGVATYAAS